MPRTPQRPLVPWADPDATPYTPTQMQLYDMAGTAGPSTIPEDDGDEENVFRDMAFDEVLEDLNARFLVNLPEEETTLVRLYWQAEQAHWFYEDYLRPLNPQLPALTQRQFTQLIISSSPLYVGWDIDYDAVWEEYCAYKKMVPCCGGILLNEAGDKVLLVRGWRQNAGWCFPRGKINSEESEVACAVREVEEETGFNMSRLIDPDAFIKTQVNAQEITMFLVLGIDESTVFQTQTRNEIGAIEWVPLVDLPTWSNKKGPKRTGSKKRFYNVTPFVGGIKKFLSNNGISPHPPRRGGRNNAPGQGQGGGRALQPFAFGDAPAPAGAGRELKPFSFGDEANKGGAGAGGTSAIDHLFAKFVHKDDQAVALESETSRTLDKLFCGLEVTDEAAGDKNDDDLLAKLLGNVGTVPESKPTLPLPDNKKSTLLSVLNAPHAPPAPTPPRTHHQSNLLSMLAPPSKSPAAVQPGAGGSLTHDDRHRVLLESTLGGLGPAGSGQPSGPPSSQPPSSHGASPMPPTWPAHQSSPAPAPQHGGYPPDPTPAGQQYAHSPPAQPRTTHQRALLGTLFSGSGAAAPAGNAPPRPTQYGYAGSQGYPPAQNYGAPPHAAQHAPPPGHAYGGYAPYPPQPPPPHNGGPGHQPGFLPGAHPGAHQPPPGHQRTHSGGLPGQPGQGRPFGAGLPGQPGHGAPPPPPPQAWQPHPPAQFGGMHPPQGYAQQQYASQQQYQQPPPHQHQGQQQQYQQQQQQQQQQQHQYQQPTSQQAASQAPPSAPPQQSPPTAIHQPVARPPVSGSLLGLAAGR